jgi:HK97 family phage prohead protease
MALLAAPVGPLAERRTFRAAVRAVGPREFKFVASTSQLARDGHVLVPSGIQLGNYRRNPVILWQHKPETPVARCTQIGIIDGELRGTAEFAPAGASASADEACALVKSGVVNALSIGFDPLEAEPLDPKHPRGGQRFLRSELLEISLVSVPADTGAMITDRNYYMRSNRALPADVSRHLIRLSENVDEAARHLSDARLHHERGEDRLVERCHRSIDRCLRDCQGSFRSLADSGMALDIENTSKAQTSDGMGYGTSGGDRARLSWAQRQARARELAAPLTMLQRYEDFVRLSACENVGDGGAVGCARIRKNEELRRKLYIAAQYRC